MLHDNIDKLRIKLQILTAENQNLQATILDLQSQVQTQIPNSLKFRGRLKEKEKDPIVWIIISRYDSD